MNNILIIGAGLSSGSLINYVLDQAQKYGWFVTIADADPLKAQEKLNGHPHGKAAWLDVAKANDRRDLLSRADVIVSLLPAHLHLEVAHDCIRLNKHLITASYVSHEMYRLGDEARDRELIFMGEMGLDPGIDHMSAMKEIDEIKARGGKLTAFRSYTGGLIAPESDTNPWRYKITWNPRNVVLAGQGTAQYLEKGKLQYIPYHRLFKECRLVEVPELGQFEVYANRDSLLYRNVYGLADIPNIFRGTLRYPGFCSSWNALIQIGLTDADFPILDSEKISYYDLLHAFVGDQKGNTLKERVAMLLHEMPESGVIRNLEWLGLFRKKRIAMANATPALILEDLIRKRWKLEKDDKDLIVMHHELEYELDGQRRITKSTMSLKGSNDKETAMAKTVGLPMGILVKLVMKGEIASRGVQIPVMPEVYNPVLKELEDYGIRFTKRDEPAVAGKKVRS